MRIFLKADFIAIATLAANTGKVRLEKLLVVQYWVCVPITCFQLFHEKPDVFFVK